MSFDLPAIIASASDVEETPVPPWLAMSWRDPKGFEAALWEHFRKQGQPPKSHPHRGCDLYHDLVGRHASGGRAALRWYDVQAGFRALTYGELHERSGRLARRWSQAGVVPAATLCVLGRLGPETLVALMAAIRLGAVFSLVLPAGPRRVTRQLASIEPTHIAAAARYVPLLGTLAERLLPETDDGAPPLERSSVVSANKPFARLLSPLTPTPDNPVMLGAGTALVRLARDALLTFMLRPGDHLAAPGLHGLQHQPALLFAAMITGATYLHLDVADVARDPSLLAKFQIRSLGVTPQLREVMRRAGRRFGAIAHWFRNPEEPPDDLAWQGWIEQAKLMNVPGTNLVIDAASGGAVLASMRRAGKTVHMEAPPAAGVSFELSHAGEPEQAAISTAGVFTSLPPDKKKRGYILLLHREKSDVNEERYDYAGTIEPRRVGRVFPAVEVQSAAETLPFVESAAVVAVGAGASVIFTLVVFTGAEAAEVTVREAGAREAAIRTRIRADLDGDAVPDRVVFFPLLARRKQGTTDPTWVAAQYLGGWLSRKTRTPAFEALTALRCAVLNHPAVQLTGRV